jgi:hypothetical protein
VAIDTVLIFTWNHAIQRSTDYGKTWTQISGLSPGAFAFTNGMLYGSSATQIYSSTDSGNTWSVAYNGGSDYLVASGGVLFSGGARSIDSGRTWLKTDSLYPNAITADGSNDFAVAAPGYMWVSSDLGAHWHSMDAAGLPGDVRLTAVCVFDSFVYVGGYDPVTHRGSGLYYRPISEILPKSAVRSPHTMPVAERLDVYPNPFGTSCTARFTLDAPSEVRVSLFDATGREVRTVFGGTLQPGLNTLPIDGTGLADGVYWCRLAANGSERVAKLSLIRR